MKFVGHKVKFVGHKMRILSGHKMKFARTISYQPSGYKNVTPCYEALPPTNQQRAILAPWMHYRIVELADPDAARVLRDTLAWLGNDREMQLDLERLVKVCCAPQLPVSIQGAPRPVSLSANA
jgi:hypothetical protein